MSDKVSKLSDRVERIGGGGAEYERGCREAEAECDRFMDSLPKIIEEAIWEYFRSRELHGSQALKDQGESWWTGHMEKLRRKEVLSSFGSGTSLYKCPSCGVEYFSGLLMAFHMFSQHAIPTRKE